MTTRKVFLAQLAGGGLGFLLAGCGGGGGGDGSDTPAPLAPLACGASFTISGHEGHLLSIPTSDLDSTTAKIYDIQGSAGHSHLVTLSPAQLADLKAGRAASVTSSEAFGLIGLHSHDLSGRCTA